MRNRRSTLLFLAGTSFLPTYAEEAKQEPVEEKVEEARKKREAKKAREKRVEALLKQDILEPIYNIPGFLERYEGPGAKSITRKQYVDMKSEVTDAIFLKGFPRTLLNSIPHEMVGNVVEKRRIAYLENEAEKWDVNGDGVISGKDDQNNDLWINDKDRALYAEKVKREQAKKKPQDKRKKIPQGR